MEKTYTKTEDGKLEVASTPEVVVSTNTYDISFLKQQLVRIQAQKDQQMTERDVEIADLMVSIAECSKLDIVETEEVVVEVTEEVVEEVI